MLNKKTVFNIVYGLALVGVISGCFGMLNEYLNVAQISGRAISNVIGKYENWAALAYPRTAFIVCAETKNGKPTTTQLWNKEKSASFPLSKSYANFT